MRVNYNLKTQMLMKFGSQLEFANRAGVTELLVSQVINGRRQLTDSQKSYWSDILGCSKDLFETLPAENAQDQHKKRDTSLRGGLRS